MARGAFPLGATLIASALCLLCLGTVALVLVQAGGGGITAADTAALRFTLWQSLLSATLSTLLAVPTARALFRRRFFGREALMTLLGAPFLLPTITAILGILAIFGRAGWLNDTFTLSLNIYGLQGVILAHVFLNMPLATRMILQGWQAIPSERLRLAAALDMPPRAILTHIEWPMLRGLLPGIWLTVFTICLSSFAVALTLGGGPRATTIELAIFQALRFDFNLPKAALLAALQFGLCAMALLAASRFAIPPAFGAGLDRSRPVVTPTGWRRGADALILLAATLFLLAPLLALLLKGLPSFGHLPPEVWPATLRSLMIALPAATLAVGAALTLALARHPSFALAATLPLAASSLVMGTGLFLAIFPYINPTKAALAITLLVNATLSLPFAYRILKPQAEAVNTDYDRLARSLDLQGWPRLRYLILPRLRRPLGFAMGVCAALSMGDLGVIALFATDNATLPLLVQRLMGAYRTDAATAAALLLVTTSFALFWIFDRIGRHDPPDA